MKNLTSLLKDFMTRDKSTVLFTFIRLSTLFLFFVSMFFGFIRGSMIINNRVSLIKFPGMWWLALIMIGLLIVSFYQTLVSKGKQAKLFYLLATILATIMFVWGNIVYKVGIPTASIGYGFIMITIMLILSWFICLKEPVVIKLISKYLVTQSTTQEDIQSQQDSPLE